MIKSPKNVLICGGSGLIGTELRRFLTKKGYHCTFFTRGTALDGIRWDPKIGWLNPDVFKSADFIINLSGAGIANRYWTRIRKREILNSRVRSTRLLYNNLMDLKHYPQVFINASAVGFYGNREKEIMTEESQPGKGFLSYTAWEWEREARKIAEKGIRTVIFRIGHVLSNSGGILPKMTKNMSQIFTGGYWGSGKQIVSWIHIKDLCRLFLFAMEHRSWNGIYNAVSPETVSNHYFCRSVAHAARKLILMPRVPSFFLKSVLGEMSTLLLEGAAVSAEKAQKSGFRFQYPKLKDALRNLLRASRRMKSKRRRGLLEFFSSKADVSQSE